MFTYSPRARIKPGTVLGTERVEEWMNRTVATCPTSFQLCINSVSDPGAGITTCTLQMQKMKFREIAPLPRPSIKWRGRHLSPDLMTPNPTCLSSMLLCPLTLQTRPRADIDGDTWDELCSLEAFHLGVSFGGQLPHFECTVPLWSGWLFIGWQQPYLTEGKAGPYMVSYTGPPPWKPPAGKFPRVEDLSWLGLCCWG